MGYVDEARRIAANIGKLPDCCARFDLLRPHPLRGSPQLVKRVCSGCLSTAEPTRHDDAAQGAQNQGETAMNHFKAVGCAALVSGLALIGQASGGDNALLKAPLMACPSDKTVIGGVNACGKIWKIGGRASN